MTSPGDSRRSLPLFPGTSCLPLSRGASTGVWCLCVCLLVCLCSSTHYCLCAVAPMGAREKLKKDQLNVIFDVIGTPTPAQLASIRTVEAKAYLKSLESRPPSNLGEKYPTAPPEAIDLLFRLLSLIPEDRITAEEALAHPFLAPVRDESTEVCCPSFSSIPPLSPMSVCRVSDSVRLQSPFPERDSPKLESGDVEGDRIVQPPPARPCDDSRAWRAWRRKC